MVSTRDDVNRMIVYLVHQPIRIIDTPAEEPLQIVL